MFLRQSTAVVVSFGPFLDKTDGVTLETGLVTALDHASTGIFLSKNGGTLTIRAATVTASTYDAYGNYKVTLSATDVNTIGTLRVQIADAATFLPVWQDFKVIDEAVYDALFGTVALSTLGGTAQTGDSYALANGANGFVALKADTAAILVDTGTTLDGRIPAALVGGRMDSSTGAMAANVLTAAATAADFTTEIQAGLATAAALTVVDDFLDTEVAAILAAVDTEIGTIVTATGAAAIRAALGLASANLDTQLTAIDDLVDTEVAAIKAKTDLIPAAPAAVGDIPSAASIATSVLTTAMTESYAANGAAPTLAQAHFEQLAMLTEKSVAGVTLTTKKRDGATTAATYTLDSATVPTAISRTT